jgi:hypothetical protein
MGKGSVTKDQKTGRWTVVYDEAPAGAPRKQRNRRGFKTKGSAQKFLTDVNHAIGEGTYVSAAS